MSNTGSAQAALKLPGRFGIGYGLPMLAPQRPRYTVRILSFGEILDLGFRITRDHFGLLMKLAATFYLPLALIEIVLAGDAPASGVTRIILTMLLVLVVSPIVNVAVTFAISELFLGRTATAGQALRYAVSILMPLLGTALLATLFILLGLLALVLPAFYLMLAFMLVWQIGVVEQRFGMTALRRSRELMRGHMLRGAGILLVSGLLVAILVSAAALALHLVPFAGTIGAQLAQAAGTIYTSAVSVLLYFDIRCRKEAFDLEHLAAAVHAAAESPQLGAGSDVTR